MDSGINGCLSQLQRNNIIPVIGVELEGYFLGSDAPSFFAQDFTPWGVEKWLEEDGQGQYEFHFGPSANVLKLMSDILRFKSDFSDIFNFSGKPYANEPGSALHLHLHLEDRRGAILFEKKHEDESPQLLWVVSALLEMMPSAMPLFFPEKADLNRIGDSLHAPTKISWGGNNRTASLRIPCVSDGANRRIEHRVPCASADIEKMVLHLLQAVIKAFEEKREPTIPKLYGNATDEQYQLRDLC